MPGQQVIKERANQTFRIRLQQLVATKTVYLIATKAYPPIFCHHLGIQARGSFLGFGIVLLAVNFNNHTDAAGEQKQEVHALSGEGSLFAPSLLDADGIIVQVDLRKQRGNFPGRRSSIAFAVRAKHGLLYEITTE